MTWQNFLRTWMIAAIGAVALVPASQARAEGSDGSGVISPEKAESFVKESADAANGSENAAGQGASNAARTKKSVKLARDAEKRKPRDAVVATADPNSVPASAAAAGKEDERAEHTAAIPLTPSAAPSRSQRTDAIRSGAMKPLIARYASENGLPYELADAVVRLESRYNPGARNGGNLGLTQINFRTAQSLGYQGAAAGLFDAETNLRFGLKYLAQAYKLAGGDTCGTILRYQFGHRTQTMTSASRTYCAKVKVITAVAD